MLLATKRWEIVDEVGSELVDKLKSAKGVTRQRLANQAARDALSALALVPGVEAAAARRLIASMAAALNGGE